MTILSLFKQPKPKKSRRAYLIKALDDLVSKQVRERDGYKCRKCGRTGKVFHHHIHTKIRLATRWILENGVTVCFWCHRWAHSAPEEFRQWVLTWMTPDAYDQLYLWSQTRSGYHDIDLEWLLKDLRRAA